MYALKLVRLIGAMAVVASAPALIAVAAHAQAPASPVETQPSTRPDTPAAPRPVDPVRPTVPSTMDQKPTEAAPGRLPATPDQATRDQKKDPMIGLAVFGADGQKVGEVMGVKADTDGKIEAIHVKTGGFLGFGGRTVVIPAGKFNKTGQNVQLAMTSDDVSKLPQVDDKAS